MSELIYNYARWVSLIFGVCFQSFFQKLAWFFVFRFAKVTPLLNFPTIELLSFLGKFSSKSLLMDAHLNAHKLQSVLYKCINLNISQNKQISNILSNLS